MKKIAAIMLVLATIVLSGVDSMAFSTKKEEGDAYSYYIWNDFENGKVTIPFTEKIDKTNASYVGGNTKARYVDWNNLSGNKSVEIKTCDFRWWTLSITEDELYIGAEFYTPTDNYTNTFLYCIQTQDPATSTSGDGGALLIVEGEKGKPVLKAAGGKKIAQLENKTKYEFLIVLKRGSDKYTIFVNDKPYENLQMKSAYYTVLSMRLSGKSKDEESSFILDNISVFCKNKYPQAFSAQEKGEVPEIKLPNYSQKKTLLFYNNIEIETSDEIIKKNGTAYIPLKDFAEAIGAKITEKKNEITISLGSNIYSAEIGSKNGVSKGKNVVFNNAPEKIARTVYAPLNMINELFNLKVWLDETGDMVVITDEKHANDDILRSLNSRFYMNGEQYYEISFNKFDLVVQTYAEYIGFTTSFPDKESSFEQAEEALKILSENGFKTIRFFCSVDEKDIIANPEKKTVYYEMMDRVFDLLDKYDIQANICMGLRSTFVLDQEYVEDYGWILNTENETDLVANPNSRSRQCLYDYIEEFVGRYKNRHCVLMWEIVNEGNLRADLGQMGKPSYSLLQLGAFYADVAKKIKETDPEHLVTGGDSCLRNAQWHLLTATLRGDAIDWTWDNQEERLKALYVLNEGLDVISAHTYNWGAKDNNNSHCLDNEGKDYLMNFDDLMREAKSLGKCYYTGEIAGGIPVPPMNVLDPEILTYQQQLLDSIVDSGVQLTHWWSFMSARKGEHTDDEDWNVTIDKTPFTFEAIKDANARLKEKYVVNGAASDNTAEVTGEITIGENYIKKDNNKIKKILTLTAGAVVLVLGCGAIVTVCKRRKERKNER